MPYSRAGLDVHKDRILQQFRAICYFCKMTVEALPPVDGGFVISPRMAGALSDPVRSRILVEIDRRPLSPTEFVDKVGGELSSTARCFRQLERWGYAEAIGEREKGRGGVATQRAYRALRLPQSTSLRELPPSDRITFSRRVLSSTCAEMVGAIETGTFDQDRDRHYSWQVILLDRAARRVLNQHFEALLARINNLALGPESRNRVYDGEEIRASIGLAAFRSPQSVDAVLKTVSWASKRHTLELTPQLVKAISNRWRALILRTLLGGPMSPTQFVEEAGGDHSYVSRCFRELAAWGWIEIDEERRGGRRGGGVERIYRLVRPPYFESGKWHSLPSSIRVEVSRTIVATYFERIAEAIEAGSLDGDADRHVTWKPLTVGREAWVEIGDRLNVLFHELPGMQKESLLRSGSRRAALIPTVVGISWFRSAASRA